MIKKYLCGWLAISLQFIIVVATAQDKIQLIYSDNIFYSKKLVDAQRVIGNVHFERQGTHLYCDSAYWFENRDFEAFGKIKIVKPSDYTLTGKSLRYTNETNVARLEGDAKLVDDQMTLTAPLMIYNMETKDASYFSGGKIVSNNKENLLTSQSGTYNTEENKSHFEKKVKLIHGAYTLTTEKLDYDNNTETAYIITDTKISSENEKLYCKKGFYRSTDDYTELYARPKSIHESQVIIADTLIGHGEQGWGKFIGHVHVADTADGKWVTGGYGEYDDKEKKQWITQRPIYHELLEEDTLFVKSDTLWMKNDSIHGDLVKAYHGALIYTTDFQAKCDSLVFQSSDSTIHFFREPILWSDARQITGDSMYLVLKYKSPHRFYVLKNSFIVSQTIAEDSSYFDQINGRNIEAFFQKGNVYRIDVKGNGELIYFPLEQEDDTIPIGLNRAQCSNISVYVDQRKIKRIKLINEPDSFLIPMEKTKGEPTRLKQFIWLPQWRPQRKDF
jgi:lipopolysaccharide export system protein LptA